MGSWSYFEDAAFRQVENGYVYSAPWFAGPSRRYLVDEAQKMALAERVRRIRQMLAPAYLAMISAMVTAIAMARSLKPHDWLFVWVVYALILAVSALFTVPAHIYAIRKLRPLLAGLPPTRERGLTWSERRELREARTPWDLRILVGGGFFFAYMCLLVVIDFAKTVQETGLTISMVLSCAALAALAAYCFAFASYKAHQS